ncbi:patatin-like phospholipase family protein [Oceanithermus sp.]
MKRAVALVFVGLLLAPALARPKVALVLGGGAARGMAHIGVIRALNEAGVPIDLIVGTSMGSIIGATYAAGYSTEVLEELAVALDPGMVVRLSFPIRGGLLDASPIETALEVLTENARIGETPVPYYLVASDLQSGEPHLFTEGSLARAVHASMAMPVLMEPVEVDGRWYYDGAYKAPVPVRMARELGADVVIVVNVTREVPFEPERLVSNVTQLVIDIIRRNSAEDLALADVVVDPGLALESYMSFDKAADFIEKGYQATWAKMPEILAVLEEKGVPLREPGDPNAARAINHGWRERMDEARRAVLRMERRFSVAPVLGFYPPSYFGGTGPDGLTPWSLFRAGLRAEGGFLGFGYLEGWYALNLNGSGGAWSAAAAYGPRRTWRVGAELGQELDGRWWLAAFAEYLPEWGRLRLGYEPLDGTLRTSAAAEGRGYALRAAGALGSDFGSVSFDARTVLALEPFELRLRGFAGWASAGAPEGERFSLGSRNFLRGYPSDAWVADAVGVANLELAWTSAHGTPVYETALLRPEAWAFVDLGYAPDVGVVSGLGLGGGVEAEIFGFLPVDVGLDVGYGPALGSWQLGLRGRVWPQPFSWNAWRSAFSERSGSSW